MAKGVYEPAYAIYRFLNRGAEGILNRGAEGRILGRQPGPGQVTILLPETSISRHPVSTKLAFETRNWKLETLFGRRS